MHVLRAHDADSLMQALAHAEGGDVIELAPGDYGDIISHASFGEPVTITSADPNHLAVMRSINLTGAGNLVFKDLDISIEVGRKGVQIANSHDIALDHLEIHGDGQARDVHAIPRSGVFIRDSSGVSVENSNFHNVNEGLEHLNSSNLRFDFNRFHEIGADGIRGGGSSNVEVKGNYFTNFLRASDEHPDTIQFWTTNTTSSAHDIDIENNVFVRSEGTIAQGIFLRDDVGHLPFLNVKIAGNAVIGGMYNGIMLDGTRGAEISDNLVLGYSDMKSWIRVEHAAEIAISRNRTNDFILKDNSGRVSQQENDLSGLIDHKDVSHLNHWLSKHPDAGGGALGPLGSLDTGGDLLAKGGLPPGDSGWIG